jgi:VIT1/CCC1 family predicted Fe2+/Mn2+ transporter
VLTFTGSVSIASADRASTRAMLVAALGCNLAWGIIDGGMYLMSRLHEQGRKLLMLRRVRDITDLATAQRTIADALPPLLAPMLAFEQLESMRRQLQQLPEPPAHPLPSRRDWTGAVAVSLVVFLSTFPIVIPFMLFDEVKLALRLSHTVAMAMLFGCGYAFGRCIGVRPWVVGVAMVAVGGVFAVLAIALGG